MERRWSLGAILTGVMAQLAGLALDGILHARDATLAEREGVLSLGNPGHALFAGGLALTILGACLWLVAPAFARKPRGAALLRALLPAAAVLAFSGGAFVVAARSGGLTGHSHAHAEDSHTHVDPPSAQAVASGAEALPHSHGAAGAPSQPQAATVGGSRHDHGQEVNVSWEQLREIDGMLATAKASTEKYRDVNVAKADGYAQVTQVVPGLGAHFVQPALLASGTFDPAHPPILLYDRAADGGWELVGLSWSLPKKPGDDTPPFPYFGSLATWHYHTDLCFGARAGSPVVSVNTPSGCRAAGGLFVKETGWMVHAWLYRESPEGVFSHENSTIKGTTPLASSR